MNADHGKGNSMIDKLKQLLAGKTGPQFNKGYERMAEDLSWRGQPKVGMATSSAGTQT